jgi:hypothetical protein
VCPLWFTEGFSPLIINKDAEEQYSLTALSGTRLFKQRADHNQNRGARAEAYNRPSCSWPVSCWLLLSINTALFSLYSLIKYHSSKPKVKYSHIRESQTSSREEINITSTVENCSPSTARRGGYHSAVSRTFQHDSCQLQCGRHIAISQ